MWGSYLCIIGHLANFLLLPPFRLTLLLISSTWLQAWALFKGKYREGLDKPDPPTWKTRLRCALNKSNDFDELVERSQLDISDPYKVYRIIPEGAKRGNFHIWRLVLRIAMSEMYLKYISQHASIDGLLLPLYWLPSNAQIYILVIGTLLFKMCSFWSKFDALDLSSSC